MKPTVEQIKQFAAEHEDAPEGIELFRWYDASGCSGYRVFIPLEPFHPVSYMQMDRDEVAVLAPMETEINPMVADRHGGWKIRYGWDARHRVAACWIE